MYHQIAFSASNANGSTLNDVAQVADPSFPPRNNHLYIVEPYEMLSAAVFGASVVGAQLDCPTWDSIQPNQLYPVNLSLEPPGNPQIVDFRDSPVRLPQIEEVVAKVSQGGAGNEVDTVVLTIRPIGGPPLPRPTPQSPLGTLARVRGIFTFTTAITASAWSPDVVLSNTNALRGGTYIVLGGQVIVAAGIAWRLNFVRAPLVNGRKLYPGGLTQHAYGDVPLRFGGGPYGQLGEFDTVNLPQISILGAAGAVSATYTAILDLLYMGGSLLQTTPSLSQMV